MSYQAQHIDVLSRDFHQNAQTGKTLVGLLGGIASLVCQLGGEPAEAVAIAGRIAEGDLRVDIALRQGDRSSMMFALSEMRDHLVHIVSRVRSGTDAMAAASREIATGNQDLSARTEAQAGALEETASAMEALTGTVHQNTENAGHANRLAKSASEIAVKGGTVVSQVVETMGSINSSSKKIVDIIGVIDDSVETVDRGARLVDEAGARSLRLVRRGSSSTSDLAVV